MTFSYKTLLITSCITFSLHSMEKETPSIQPLSLEGLNLYHIEQCYRKTCNYLEKFEQNNTQSITNVCKIITLTDKLKNKKNIEEKHIGLFTYQQKDSLKNQIFTYIDYERNLYENPLYVSVFFEQLGRYKKKLKENSFTSPTPDQYNLYTKNKQRIIIFNKIKEFKLDLDIHNVPQEATDNIPKTIAITEFEDLLRDIINLLTRFSPDEIEIIADDIYSNTTNKEQSNTSEKL